MTKFISIIAAAAMAITGCSSGQSAQAEEPIKTIDEMAEEIISDMTLEEKVGQMFLVRYTDDEKAVSDIDKYKFGGYLLFAKDFQDKTKDDVIKSVSDCQSASKVPLFIGVDEEGGIVNRVSKFPQFRNEPFKSPRELYNEGGYELISSDTQEKCELLKSLGINVNLAPVCDVLENPDSFMYERTLGQDADATSEYVSSVVEVMSKNNMGSALKHFPGYGDNGDTHTDIITDNRPIEEFKNSDFKPFAAGISAGADMVLVSHNIVTAMDDAYPASLSPDVHKILREELNFDGIIITDDLSMQAITKYTDGSAAAVQAVKAGNDLLCCTDYEVQIPAVIEAVKNGDIAEEAVNSSVKRIIKTKLKLGIME